MSAVVEVFKTNVMYADKAHMLIDKIQRGFPGYCANFDLDDCDHILRVMSPSGIIDIMAVVSLVNDLGFHAEVLPD